MRGPNRVHVWRNLLSDRGAVPIHHARSVASLYLAPVRLDPTCENDSEGDHFTAIAQSAVMGLVSAPAGTSP
jgi:hypothetical protein